MAGQEAMRLVVAGASGRMGRSLIRAISEHPATRLHGAFGRAGSDAAGRDAGTLAEIGEIGVAIGDDANAALDGADGLIDFTAPASTVALAKIAAERGIVHVIGTTGLSAEDIGAIETASETAAIVRSGNMSLGVNLLSALLRQAAKALPASDFDIEIVEMHHRHKVDAPSGTALLLGEAAAEGRGIRLDDHAVRSRDGHTGAREEGAIGFATLRGGSVTGDHSAILAGPGERITLGHVAEDRMIFARGAVTAALWAAGRTPGHYSMADVLGIGER